MTIYDISLVIIVLSRAGTCCEVWDYIDVHGDDKLAEESEEKRRGCGGVGGGGKVAPFC